MPKDLGAIEIARVTHLPAEPRAGQSFVVIIELNRDVAEREGELVVSLVGRRLSAGEEGMISARPVGRFYFLDGYDSQSVPIRPGHRRGVSASFVMRKDAAAEPEESPVRFPESLLFIASGDDLQAGFCGDLVQLQAPEEVRQILSPAFFRADDLVLGQKVPNRPERGVVGAATAKIVRGTPELDALLKNMNADIVFKDEEGTEADRMMTTKLGGALDSLAALVKAEWPGIKLRVTEAWDENNEHGANSTHYEARGADLTTSDRDGAKLGRLGRLAVNAGFEWVFYENSAHIHASMSK